MLPQRMSISVVLTRGVETSLFRDQMIELFKVIRCFYLKAELFEIDYTKIKNFPNCNMNDLLQTITFLVFFKSLKHFKGTYGTPRRLVKSGSASVLS